MYHALNLSQSEQEALYGPATHLLDQTEVFCNNVSGRTSGPSHKDCVTFLETLYLTQRSVQPTSPFSSSAGLLLSKQKKFLPRCRQGT